MLSASLRKGSNLARLARVTHQRSAAATVAGFVARPGEERVLIHRLGDGIALDDVAADHAQDIRLVVLFDPLGDRFAAQAVDQADHRLRDQPSLAARGDMFDQAAVELDAVDRQLAKARQAGMAGAVIVNRDRRAIGA